MASTKVLNIKPKNQSVILSTQIYTETRTVSKGQSMGLLLALTFPVAGTYTNATRI